MNMKRDFVVLMFSIAFSFVLFGVLLTVSLKYSAWGQFAMNPRVNQASPATIAAEHPDVLPSLERQLVVMHLLILPFVCGAVGAVAGATARKPIYVAVLGVLPFRVLIMTSDSLRLLTILSLLLDIGVA